MLPLLFTDEGVFFCTLPWVPVEFEQLRTAVPRLSKEQLVALVSLVLCDNLVFGFVVPALAGLTA
jgi:hypothetical protein